MLNILRTIWHWCKDNYYYVRYLIWRNSTELPEIASIEETIDVLINERKSIARFGDGEIRWMLDLPQDSFQDSSESMQNDLLRVFKKENENCLIGFLPEFATLQGHTKRSKQFWQKFLSTDGNAILKYLDNSRKYYNSEISRCYMEYEDSEMAKYCFEHLKLLWKDRNILIVEGTKTRLGIGNDLFECCASIRRILAPATNAYDRYRDIFDCILENVKNNDLVLLALGPTATILAYDLSNENIQAVDIGHVDIEYEWMRMGTHDKVAIKNKYVNEAGELGKIVGDITDDKYFEEIICSIE